MAAYATGGFRGLPFFRFGLECDPSAGGEAGDGPCATVDVELAFANVPRRFAQVVVYRARAVEAVAFGGVPGAHICGGAGQLYGVAIFANTSDAVFVLESSSSPWNRGGCSAGEGGNDTAASDAGGDGGVVCNVRGRIALSQPGLYIVYPHMCTFDVDTTTNHDDDDEHVATGASSNDAADVRRLVRDWRNASVSGRVVVRSRASQQLPSQVADLLPAYTGFACAALAMLLAFVVGAAAVGWARVLKYQLALAATLALDAAASACIVLTLRRLRAAGDGDGGDGSGGVTLLMAGIVCAAARDTVARTLAVFMLLGAGLTRLRFTAQVSGAIIVCSVIYFVARVFVDRTRLASELSLDLLSSPGFELATERLVMAAVESALAVFLAVAARHTLGQLAAGDLRRRVLLRRTVGVFASYAACSALWWGAQFALFFQRVEAAELNWRRWWLIEAVPQVLVLLALAALLFVWAPSRDSRFWVCLAYTDESDGGAGAVAATHSAAPGKQPIAAPTVTRRAASVLPADDTQSAAMPATSVMQDDDDDDPHQ